MSDRLRFSAPWRRWLGQFFAASRDRKRRRTALRSSRVERLEVRLALTAFVVDTTADEDDGNFTAGDFSLREAINLANANSDVDTITFDAALNGQTISLTITGDTTVGPTALVISNPVSIVGPTGSNGIILAGLGSSANLRAFYVTQSGNLTLENLALKDFEVEGGRGGVGGGGGAAGLGGVIFNRGTLDIRGSTFKDNKARGGNGADSDVAGMGGGGGGGLGGDGSDGLGGGGGGGGTAGDAGASTSTNGGAGGAGGTGGVAGAAGNGGSVPGSGGNATGAGGGGGGIGPLFVGNGGDGGAGGDGGGGGGGGRGSGTSGTGGNGGIGGFGGGGGAGARNINSVGGNGAMGGFGGGGGAAGGSLFGSTTPGDSDYGGGTGGTAGTTSGAGGGGAGLGGAIFNDEGTVTIQNSTFYQNTAAGGTGGLGSVSGGGGGNGGNGLGQGGAIFSRNGTVTITNATLSNNLADDGGRDLFLLHDGDGISVTAVIDNSILGQADNSITDFATGMSGTINPASSSGTNNLIRNQTTFGGTASSADPQLGSIQNNGGPTFTLALLTGSPAIDAGSNSKIPAGITTDQRGPGFARVDSGTVDIGAYEFVNTPPSVTLELTVPLIAESGGATKVKARLSAATSSNVTVNLSFSGTATNVSDYTRSANQIVILAGATEGEISLTAVQDAVIDPNETIVVDIASVVNATESGVQQVFATIIDDETRMYRVYNANAGLHVFTTSAGEYSVLVGLGYNDETTTITGFSVCSLPLAGTIPIHRAYNPNAGHHYLTTSQGEVDVLVANGWFAEPDQGYLFTAGTSGVTEIYHIYHETNGDHLYTANDLERVYMLTHPTYPSDWSQQASLGYSYTAAAAVAPRNAPAVSVSLPSENSTTSSNDVVASLIAQTLCTDDGGDHSVAAVGGQMSATMSMDYSNTMDADEGVTSAFAALDPVWQEFAANPLHDLV